MSALSLHTFSGQHCRSHLDICDILRGSLAVLLQCGSACYHMSQMWIGMMWSVKGGFACYAGVDSGRLYRVLRSAVQMGVFAAVPPKGDDIETRFKNNRLSACLREDHPNCLRHMVRATSSTSLLPSSGIIYQVQSLTRPLSTIIYMGWFPLSLFRVNLQRSLLALLHLHGCLLSATQQSLQRAGLQTSTQLLVGDLEW